MKSRRRRRARAIVSPATLAHAFERRSFVIGAVQGGLGLILASRMAYLSIFEN